MPLEVLFFSHYFPPEGNAPASRTYENMKRWVRWGHRVTVVTCAPNHPDGVLYPGYRNRLRQREVVDGIEVLRVWSFIAANEGVVLRSANYVSYMVSAVLGSIHLDRPHLIIATTPQFFAGWAGVLAARRHRVPLLLEVRDIWPESIGAVGAIRSRGMLGLVERLAQRMYAASSHIVTVGEGYRRRLLEQGLRPERVSVITNGIDRERFQPRPCDGELRRSLGLEGRFVCSYIGTLGMASGLDVVLRSAELLREQGRKDIAFLLVGDGAIRARLQSEVQRRDLGDRVYFTGRQDKSRIPDLLALSDACLVHLLRSPLFTTVLPSKIFEAAGMARPIVLGVAGHAAEVVREAGAGLCIEPENEHELVRAVVRLADDPELRATLGRKGYEHVVRHYDRDTLARDYLELAARVSGRTLSGSGAG